MSESRKPNVYINPKAPQWLRDIVQQALPDANKMDAEEMQKKLDEALTKDHGQNKPTNRTGPCKYGARANDHRE